MDTLWSLHNNIYFLSLFVGTGLQVNSESAKRSYRKRKPAMYEIEYYNQSAQEIAGFQASLLD